MGHGHAHGESGLRPLILAMVMTGSIFLAELVGGWWSGSLALIADATHMAVDLLGLGLALFAAALARMPADPRRTFGYRRVEVLAALGNSVALMVATGFILREAWARWTFPTPIAVRPMMGVAALGLACNLVSAAMLWRASKGNINMRAALLHVLSDAAGSVGALAGGALIMKTRLYEIDAIVSVLICFGIVFSAYWLLKDSIHILLEGAPPHLNIEEIRTALSGLDGVKEVHDLHLWSVTQGQEAMSGHIVIADGRAHAPVLKAGRRLLSEKFGLTHVTLQVETED